MHDTFLSNQFLSVSLGILLVLFIIRDTYDQIRGKPILLYVFYKPAKFTVPIVDAKTPNLVSNDANIKQKCMFTSGCSISSCL